MEMKLQRTSRGVIRHIHMCSHTCTHTHTHTIPPRSGTEGSPPDQEEQGAVQIGKIGKLRLRAPDLHTHL